MLERIQRVDASVNATCFMRCDTTFSGAGKGDCDDLVMIGDHGVDIKAIMSTDSWH